MHRCLVMCAMRITEDMLFTKEGGVHRSLVFNASIAYIHTSNTVHCNLPKGIKQAVSLPVHH